MVRRRVQAVDWRPDLKPKLLSLWATEAKNHLLKYRPKMAAELQNSGKLDESAEKAANRAVEEYAQSVGNGMSALEAQSEAKRNHLFLPAEEDMPELGADPKRTARPCQSDYNSGSDSTEEVSTAAATTLECERLNLGVAVPGSEILVFRKTPGW